jgi:hypothetical protein
MATVDPNEWEDVPATAPAAKPDDELAFLKPGYKRPKVSPDEWEDVAAEPAGPPDKIGVANASYQANLDAMKGMTNGEPTAEHPLGRIQASKAQSALGGVAQGASLGFADELTGLGSAIGSIGSPGSFADRYRAARDESRADYKQAREDNPISYGAGELGGSLVTAPLLPGGPFKAGGSVAKAAANAAISGGLQGAAQGLGASDADLTQGDFHRAFKDAGVAGVAGGLTGGVLGAAGARLVGSAEKNAQGWVIKDIIGEAKGASTATARKQLADDAAGAQRLMRGDKELDSAINSARHGGVDELKDAQTVIQDRLEQQGSKLDPRWAEVSKQLPGGGVRAGDLVDHLKDRIDSLRATGLTTDAAEADALDGIANRVKGARDWGAKASVQLDQKGAQDVQALTKIRGNVKDPATLKKIDDQIAAINATGKKVQAFDPETIVPAQQVQKLWSDEAGIAYSSMGGINGTASFNKKLDVAGHLRDFRDQILEQAANKNPKVVSEIRSINQDYSALKRMQTVIDQRVNAATANAGGASIPANITGLGHKLMHAGGLTGAGAALAFGHYKTAAGLAALQLGVASKRAIDRGLANSLQSSDAALAGAIQSLMQRGVPQETAIQMVRQAAPTLGAQALQRGIPQAVAIQAARAAAPGGMARDAIDSATQQ